MTAISVTSKKSPNFCKSCQKRIPLVKWKILTPLQKLPKMCWWNRQNNYCLGLWKVAQGIKSRPIWSHWLQYILVWFEAFYELSTSWLKSFILCTFWWAKPWSSVVEGDEQPHRHNSQKCMKCCHKVCCKIFWVWQTWTQQLTTWADVSIHLLLPKSSIVMPII